VVGDIAVEMHRLDGDFEFGFGFSDRLTALTYYLRLL